MNFLKGTLTVILAVFLALLLLPIALAFVAYIGYYVGIVLIWLAGFVLATNGIEKEVIPTITAWLFVAGAIIKGTSTAVTNKEESE